MLTFAGRIDYDAKKQERALFMKMFVFRYILICLSCLLLSVSLAEDLPAAGQNGQGGSGEAVPGGVSFPAEPLPKDSNRVFYEIFTGSFSDSDGDGIGDLKGILQRLDYLNDGKPDSGLSLGVEGVWLTPVFQSVSYHKYDVTDYYTIDPAFGTMEDLKRLVDGCHERGMLLILDLPINHTGSAHRWFRMFSLSRRMDNVLNPYYDYYVCCREEERLPGHAYTALSGTDLFYEANFSSGMPELNFDNEAVRQEMLNVAKYYLELGVDGFRFDAAKYIYLNDHEASVAFWEWYTQEIRAIRPDAYLVAEVWDSDSVTERYASCMSCFNFTVSQAEGLISETAQAGNVNRYTAYVQKMQESLQAKGGIALYTPFIANHDTDRAAGFLPVSNGRMMMAANLYLLGPGSPFIYYGEEIGLKGSRGGAPSDANRRLAMRWGDGDPVADPPGTTYDASKQTGETVESMKGSSYSLYNYYKRLLLIRSAHPEIARGTYRALNLQEKMGGFVSSWNGSSVLVMHNTTQRAMSVDLAEIGEEGFTRVSAVIGQGEAFLQDTVLTLEGQTSVVLR